MWTWRVERLALAFLLVAQVAHAAPETREGKPDMEFLEFLGTWELGDGQSVDPLMLGDAAEKDGAVLEILRSGSEGQSFSDEHDPRSRNESPWLQDGESYSEPNDARAD